MSNDIDDAGGHTGVKWTIWIMAPVLGILAILAAALWPEFQARSEAKLQEAQGDLSYAISQMKRP